MKAVHLRTEYLTNPLGIDILTPRLQWWCEGGIRQTAYQIACDQWDSGKVISSSMHADYPLMLSERERVEWKVRLWDEKDMPGDWSESACFEMGIRQWIYRNRCEKRMLYPNRRNKQWRICIYVW